MGKCRKKDVMKFFLILLVLFFSCSKRSGNNMSRADLLVNKKWKISAISVQLPNGMIYPDNYSTLPSYKKDDYFYFNNDLTFTDNDNIERAPTTDSSGILDSGKWGLANSENDLQMVSTLFQTGTAIEYYPTKFLELTNTSMKWESTSPYNGMIVWTSYTVIP